MGGDWVVRLLFTPPISVLNLDGDPHDMSLPGMGMLAAPPFPAVVHAQSTAELLYTEPLPRLSDVSDYLAQS